MTPLSFQPGATRVKQAQLAQTFKPSFVFVLQLLSLALIATGIGLAILRMKPAYSLLGAGISISCLVLWVKYYVLKLDPRPIASSNDLSALLPMELVSSYQPAWSASELFNHLAITWDGAFLLVRYEISPDACRSALADFSLIHNDLWLAATTLAQRQNQATLTNANIMVALFTICPALAALITAQKLTLKDFEQGATWAARLGRYTSAKRPMYGGLARDWASGFTPLLTRFGDNLSHQVEFAGKYFQLEERTTQLDTFINSLTGSRASVVLVGEPGIGKTALMLGLADRILQGVGSGRLTHHQIVSLNASIIIAEAEEFGTIEEVVMALFNEAIQARNIILALDEAQLFFGHGVGAVNLSQILLPYLQSRNLDLILAVTPGDWQRLKATNTAMTSLLTPLVLSEPDEADTISTLADRGLLMESAAGVTITYEALREAYRLAGRYLQEEAYPGRALKVLESSLNLAENGLVTAHSVQLAIEGQFGVKAGSASPAETATLLGLEDSIHQRMINQTRAVSVVANALRRARAGVANPKRPIGSFLFLGPTGVGKTELARSLAAVYFGDEANMVRLDMSEYQQIADVDRLLADASTNPAGLLPHIRQTPFSVVLFDEIEKAHPNVLNLFLQLLDEGSLTDLSDRAASFRDAIIIATSNAGADEIRQHIEAGEELADFEQPFIDDLVNSGQFKPELLNRFDEIVLFRPLTPEELAQVVGVMLQEVNKTLEAQQIKVKLTAEAIQSLVDQGYDPRLGARPMRRMVTRKVEDAVAGQILRGEAKPGDTIILDFDLQHLAGPPEQA